MDVLELVVLFDLPDQGSDSISPSFSHTSSFSEPETTTVGWTTSQSSRKTVTDCQLELKCARTSLPVFVNNDTSFEITISPWSSDVPDIHPHSGHGSIRRSHEIGIVEARAVCTSAIYPVQSKEKASLPWALVMTGSPPLPPFPKL